MIKGNRKLIFFTLVLGISSWKLTGVDLSNVVIALVTGFGIANGAEHIGAGMKK